MAIKMSDQFLSRRETLRFMTAVGMTALAGCGGNSGTIAPTSTATAGSTKTPTPGATSTGTAAPPTPTISDSTATPTRTTQPATASPTGTPTSTVTPSPAALSCVVTPEETEGPYFVDERLNRSDLTTDTTDSNVLDALPLRLQFGVYSVNGNTCTPVAGAQVDVWHADAGGVYSDVQAQNTIGQTYLRGYQLTDGNGAAEFTTVYPGWYPGRTVHIHFKIRTFSPGGTVTFEFTSQVFFDDTITDVVFASAPYNARGQRDTRNATDMVYNTGTGSAPSGAQLMLDLQPSSDGAGYTAAFTVGLRMS